MLRERAIQHVVVDGAVVRKGGGGGIAAAQVGLFDVDLALFITSYLRDS